VAGRYLQQRWQGTRAFRQAKFTARLKQTAWWNCLHGWNRPFDGLEGTSSIRLQRGYRVQKSTGVGVRRSMENFALRSQFHEIAGIHHRDAVGDLGNDREVMRNKEHGQAKLGSQFGEELENLRLHGDIESGGGFIGNQQHGTIHYCHRDHDALAHASGELIRVIAGTKSRVRDRYCFHRRHGVIPSFPLCDIGMHCDGLGDLFANSHHWIQRSHGLLKNHGYLRSAQASHLFVGKPQQIVR